MKVQRLRTGPIQLREHTPTGKHAGLEASRWQPQTRLTLRRAGNLSRGHQNTRKVLKRKKRTDTQTENKARFDGKKKLGT